MAAADREANQRHRDGLICALLLGLAAVMFCKDIAVGGLRYSDACTHAMDGVLIHDWVLSGPSAWLEPLQFAIDQYAHYPTLGMGRVYPPGFAIVESLFFAVFGISAVSARLCIVSFGLAAALGSYKLARRFTTPLAAACATGFLISMPGVVYWTRQVMLEMPTLAVLIWATYAALRYFERPAWGRLVVAMLLMLAAPLFKQTAVFIVPVLGTFFLIHAWKRRIPVRHVWVSGAVVILPLAGLFGYTLMSGGLLTHMAKVVSLGKPMSEWLSWQGLAFYPRTLPHQVGYLLLAFAGLGLLLSLRGIRGPWGLMLLWFGLFFCMSFTIQHKESRYFFFGYLPIAMWAGLGAAKLISLVGRGVHVFVVKAFRVRHVAISFGGQGPPYGLIPVGIGRAVVGALLVGMLATMGYQTPTPAQPDFVPLIAAQEPQIRGRVVLFEGHRDGDFVFAARRRLGLHGCVVIRGSKVFYSCASDPRFDFTSYVSSREDVREIIDSFGFETLFLERGNVWDLAEINLLREELNDPQAYELVESHELTVARPDGTARTRIVDVYRPKHPPKRRIRFVDVPVPIAGGTIRIDLDAATKRGHSAFGSGSG